MKFETDELIENLDTFNNGCAFRVDFKKSGLVISVGCYNLSGLASGAHKYLNELIGSGYSVKLGRKHLVEHPLTVKNTLRKTYKKCRCCEKRG